MGAKQSKGIPNPFTCLRGLGRKNKVVPMCSNVVVNGRTSEPAPSELRSRNPTSRRGWISSDLVLEDVDIEAETYGIAPAVLPPVIPPPGMRGAAYMTRHHEQELLDAMYLNIPIYDDGYSPLSDEEDEETPKGKRDMMREEREQKRNKSSCRVQRSPLGLKRAMTTTNLKLYLPVPVFYAEMIETELSQPQYDGRPAEDKQYVEEEKEEKEHEKLEEESLSQIIQEIMSTSEHDLQDCRQKVELEIMATSEYDLRECRGKVVFEEYKESEEESLSQIIREILST